MDVMLNKSAVNYIYITDMHYMGIKTGQGAVLLSQMEQIVDLANGNDEIDMVVLGGDTVQGYWKDKRDCFLAYREILSVLKRSKKPTLILVGNHDDNSYAEWNEDFSQKVISDLDWQREILTPFAVKDREHDKDDPNSKYYYYDHKKENRTIRVLCLDAADYKTEYDENGVITRLSFMGEHNENSPESRYKYQTGITRWGYSAEQVRWVSKALANNDDFDDVIIFSHMAIDDEANRHETFFGDELRAVIKAYMKKTPYKNDELGIDVCYNDSGKILIYHYGHVHMEEKQYFEDLAFWQIASSTARADQSKPFDAREAGSEREPCFDIVSVDETIIKKYNIGGGTDCFIDK